MSIVLTLAWGAFAFGATYPWASRPLMAACVLSGAAAWFIARGSDARVPVAPLLFVVLAIGLQLLPLPAGLVASLSPNTLEVVRQIDAMYAVEPGPHALSIAPAATVHALGLCVAFAVLLAGVTRFLSQTGPRWLLWALTAMGVALALVGIGQKALGDGIRIYGFWTPLMPGTPFGPFVNRNHFAGWMVMALPLTLALIGSGFTRARHLRAAWRDRLLWLASTEGSRVILAAAAAAIMGIATVMTMSRSGMASLTLALIVTGLVVLRGRRTTGASTLIWIAPVAMIGLIVAWAGIDAIVSRFAETNWNELNLRLGAWSDARDIASRFVLAGTGLNTYGTATLLFQRHDLEQHYAQAHNDYLQVWAEGGLLLAIPATIFMVAAIVAIRRRFREDEPHSTSWWARTGAATGLLAIMLQETFEFSLQMPGNAALFVVLGAIALHRAPARGRRVATSP